MSPCLTSIQLEQLVQGRLDAGESVIVSKHLETCQQCRQTVNSMNDSQTARTSVQELMGGQPHRNQDHLLSAKTLVRERSVPAMQVFPIIEGYEILQELGRGGMGIVYQAEQLSLERLVALKVMLPGSGFSQNEAERFRAEALAVGMLKHPGFVQIHEIGEWHPTSHQTLPYFCLEYVEEGGLDKRLKQQSMPAREAAELVEQLACSMQVAHEAGLVHRDLKPANVLLSSSGQSKIADFGLVKRLDIGSSQTLPGYVVGTPSYMAPEQANGHDVGPAADIYGLGAILYEMLTGRAPFVGTTPLETLVQVTERLPVPPRQLQPRIPRDLETVCLRCLAKDPAKRYASAADLADDLQRFLDGKPTVARPPGDLERLMMWSRRHPAIALLTTLLAVVIVTSLVGLTLLNRRSETLRQQAVEERNSALQAKLDMEQSQKGTYALNQFLLEHILTAPMQMISKKGKNMTLLDVIDYAAPKVPGAFAGFPEIESSIQDAFGQTCSMLGEYEKAVVHLKRALELRRQYLGKNNEFAIESQVSLANVLIFRSELDQAEPLLKEAYAYLRENMGMEHPKTLKVLGNYAHLQARRSRFVEAGELYQTLYELKQRHLGAMHPDTLEVRMGLADVLQAEGKFAEAIEHCQAVADAYAVQLGETNQGTIVAHRKLGDALLNGGHPDQAAPILEKTLQGYRDYISKKHPSLFSTQASLADAWQQLGKLTEAEAGFREALAGYRATMPANDWLIPVTQFRLGSCLAQEKQFEDAERQMKEAFALLEKANFVPASRRRDCYQRMINLYFKWGKAEQAAEWKERLGKLTK
ncbi:MAG: serine/threonine-protein kinase [Gemmatales bacterium]